MTFQIYGLWQSELNAFWKILGLQRIEKEILQSAFSATPGEKLSHLQAYKYGHKTAWMTFNESVQFGVVRAAIWLLVISACSVFEVIYSEYLNLIERTK